MKKYSIYNVINVIAICICLVFVVVILGFESQKVLFGVLLRGFFGLLMIYNGIYLIFTKGYSFIVKNSTAKNRKILGIIILLTGIIGFVTAVMGHGLNGYPILDWSTVF